ncbi:NAD(P)H-dependent flavin oxidoreductase [Zhaonella formicivorans]|uniref:NAD(P)H-dependent flavin oxidoreductase n=1 Tax=Zhaonella formicivorans TaxID=2528593 RepID=UPI0010E5F9B7|nr:nitronate monooxygenase [Zhaonella formicivorans]
MQLPELKIGNLVAKVPIIQGGMAVRISTAPLAAAVANQGGVGLIAATGMNVEELRGEIKKARKLSGGIIGVNVLFAVSEFAKLVKTAMEERIDLVVSGAGFSRDMFSWGKSFNIPVVPIVSSAKLARLAEKLGAAAVIVEGGEAGGHLGTLQPMKEILPEVREAVDLPVIGAGGIVDGKDIAQVLALGANGVQMGTRFAASEESNASPEFKALYVAANENDVTLINSPVGLPGRAIRNLFVEKLMNNDDCAPQTCVSCLKKCTKKFCILAALNKAQKGMLQEGLVFAGQCVSRIKEILPVRTIFKNLLAEIDSLSV